jgi:carbon-monoxide dehydrogenase medium subunit
MYPFAYLRPASLEEAQALHRANGDARYLAGGQTLIPTLKQRLAQPAALIDLAHIPGLAGIRRDGSNLWIGAGTRHAEVAVADTVAAAIPALAGLAAHIGDPAVRHRGTLGGSIANNDPAADYPAAVLALGATVHTASRRIAADDFFTGMFETALAEGEIVTGVSFPVPERAAYMKFPNPASRYAMVGVFVAKFGDTVRVAVTGAAPCVYRETAMEEALARNFAPAALEAVRIAPDDLNSDLHGSADYRAHLVGVMARRAVAAALA